MAKKESEPRRKVVCPMCMMMDAMEGCMEQHSEFVTHMRNARIEFLEGIKSVIDSHIDRLRKKSKSSSFKKVEVTD